MTINLTDEETEYTQEVSDNDPTAMEDCCRIAKDVFHESIKKQLGKVNSREQELNELLSVEDLQCEDFYDVLNKISKIGGSTLAGVEVAIINAMDRYFRTSKIPTSMYGTTANVVKIASAEALEAWVLCRKRSSLNESYNTQDNNWQKTLMRSEDLKYHTWDNILLSVYKPLSAMQKSHIIKKSDINKANIGAIRSAALNEIIETMKGEPTLQDIRDILEREGLI